MQVLMFSNPESWFFLSSQELIKIRSKLNMNWQDFQSSCFIYL